MILPIFTRFFRTSIYWEQSNEKTISNEREETRRDNAAPVMFKIGINVNKDTMRRIVAR